MGRNECRVIAVRHPVGVVKRQNAEPGAITLKWIDLALFARTQMLFDWTDSPMSALSNLMVK